MAEVRAGTPEWWRKRLMEALDTQCKRVALSEKYFDGDHPLPTPPQAMDAAVFAEAKAMFLSLSKKGITNWARMIARAPAERLILRGFRFGEAAAPDDDARRLWQTNHLDADSQLLHDTVFSTGQAYGLVWPSRVLVGVNGSVEPEPGAIPSMTFEHPSEMIVAYAAGSRRRRVAALKRWTAEDGRLMVTLYTPGWVYKWRSQSTRPGYGMAMGDLAWQARVVSIDDATDEPWPLRNPLGVVPVVEFAINTGLKARPFGGGLSEFDAVLAIQDRINATVFNRLVTGEGQAFLQRYAIGWKPPVDPVTKLPDPRAVFKASVSSLWTFPDPETKVGEFKQADLEGFIKAVESDVNAMAAITQTPPHYLLGAMVNISGDAMATAESGLTTKTEAHATVLGEPHEEFMRLGLAAFGSKSATDEQSQVIWADIERRSWATKIDGLVKLRALGVPDAELWAMVPGITSIDVQRWKDIVAAEPPEPAPDPAIP